MCIKSYYSEAEKYLLYRNLKKVLKSRQANLLEGLAEAVWRFLDLGTVRICKDVIFIRSEIYSTGEYDTMQEVMNGHLIPIHDEDGDSELQGILELVAMLFSGQPVEDQLKAQVDAALLGYHVLNPTTVAEAKALADRIAHGIEPQNQPEPEYPSPSESFCSTYAPSPPIPAEEQMKVIGNRMSPSEVAQWQKLFKQKDTNTIQSQHQPQPHSMDG